MATASEVESVVRSVVSWAGSQQDVLAVALVGSWARGTASGQSDIDLIFLTDNCSSRRGSVRWLKQLIRESHLPNLVKFIDRTYGVAWSRQARLRGGLDIEFTFASQSWANTSPIDSGTRHVISGGFRPLYDPQNLLRNLQPFLTA